MFVRFRVDSWWKGDLADEIVLVTDQTLLSDGRAGTTSCEFDFKKGETYLVFAGLNKAAAMPQTNKCSLTRPANDVDGSADRVHKILGESTLPITKKTKPRH